MHCERIIWCILITNNLVHNILELFTVLVQGLFNTSETELDIYFKKLYKPVASQIANQFKTKEILGKSQNEMRTQPSVHFSLQSQLALTLKKHAKIDIKAF